MEIHDLCHTQTSLLIQQEKYPKVISESLGHARAAFTNALYVHLMPCVEQAAAGKVTAAWEWVISTPEQAFPGKRFHESKQKGP